MIKTLEITSVTKKLTIIKIKEEYNIFLKLVLDSQAGHQKQKDTLIEMVKLAYTLSGKGKNRKRTLEEVIEIINDKTNYFDKIKNNSINPNINCNNNEI